MAKEIKEIRATFDDPSAREAVRRLTVLSVIKGDASFEATLAEAIQSFIDKKEHKEALDRGTWLSPTELIERLKLDGIKTNTQTLWNYRNAGKFDGFYCSDGEKKVFYLYEKVKGILGNPPARTKPEKVAVV